MQLTLTVIALLGYLAAAFFFLFELTLARHRLEGWGVRLVWGAFAIHVASVVEAAVVLHPAALFGLPFGLSLVAFLLMLGYLLLRRFYRIRPMGSLVVPLAVVLLAVVVLSGPKTAVSEPVRGVILPIHIILAFAGTVAFALAFVVAVLYSLQDYQLRHKHFGALFRSLPSLNELDNVSLRCVSVGFPMYTAAMLLGTVWALQRPGKAFETGIALSVATWLIYGIVLHARLTAGWRGRKAAWMTIAGFLSAAGVVVAYLVR